MSRPSVLPATPLSDLLGRRVPLIAAAAEGAAPVQGVDGDAQGQPVWVACPAVQWSTLAALPGAHHKVIVHADTAAQALQAQEAGAAAVVVPLPALSMALAVLSIPVVVGDLLDGRGLVQALDQGAQGGCLAPQAPALEEVLAQANRLWPIFAASSAQLASPVCYAPEFERERNAPLVAQLNAVLAQERTLARAAVHVPQCDAKQLNTTIAACAALRQSVRDLEALACTRTLALYTTVVQAPVAARALLWQAGLQQVKNQWENLAKTVFPQMDNAHVLEGICALRLQERGPLVEMAC